MDQKKVGTFLSQLRKEKGLSQKELAQKIGVTDKTISRWETGTYMPDIDTFAVLSEFYGVLINELISGERLDAQAVIRHSEENVRTIAKESKRKIKTICTAAVSAIICLSLVFLSVCCFIFLDKRRKMLYPAWNADEVTEKVDLGTLEVTKSVSTAALFEDTVNGTSFAFGLPAGYVKRSEEGFEDGVYVKDGSYIWIRTVSEFDFHLYSTPELSQYFALNNINRAVDKINFAYMYNLEEVTIFDSENTIAIAGGVRILRDRASFHNIEEEPGFFYCVCGDHRGYVMSAYPQNAENNTLCIGLENGSEVMIIIFVNPPFNSKSDLADFISSFEFH